MAERADGTGPDTTDHGAAGVHGRSGRRRRVAALAWVASVVAAAVLGAWSFAHADPSGQYERPEPLSDAGVKHELAQERATRSASPGDGSSPSPSGSASSSNVPSSSPSSSSSKDSGGSSDSSDSSGGQKSRTATVRFPGGVATAMAECRADGRVRLVSWSPSEGYSIDDIERGPAKSVAVEVEPLDDGDDIDVAVRCVDGEPHSAAVPEDEDDD